MPMQLATRSSVVPLTLFLAACAGAEGRPLSSSHSAPLGTAAPPADATTPDAATAPAGSAAAPAPAPAPSGNQRLLFELVASDSDPPVRARFDVPAAFAIELDDGRARLATCAATTSPGSSEMKGLWMMLRGLQIRAEACNGEAPKVCIERLARAVDSRSETPAIAWKGDTFGRIDRTAKGKSGPRRVGGTLAYDAATKSVVLCGFDLEENAARHAPAYLAVCGSVAVDAAVAEGTKAVAREASHDPAVDGAARPSRTS